MEPIDLEELVAQALESTGLDDFGSETWREGAGRLAGELNEKAELTELGTAIVSGEIVAYLTSRLQVIDWVKRNPEIAGRDIRPPIVVLGMPRTGTTILFDVLSQDPANRAPLTWEVDRPWPPPETATYETDPRIDEVQANLEGTELLIPGFLGMHDLGARLAQECVRITAGEFRSMIFSTQYRVPEYQRWLLHEADMAPAYRYHRTFLQYLQSAHPAERWVIKSPAHLWAPGAMIHEYPGALVINTHRDPLRVVCSLASVVDLLRRLASDKVSIDAVAQEWAYDIAEGLDRAVAARRDGTIPDKQAVDVHFADFLADPLAVVREIYERLDIELIPTAETRMRAFLAENRQERHGGHSYTFADTGLDEGGLRERMRPYQDYFGVPNEPLP
ncbi:MAG TPA: sulfotransferase [Acidimicrobiales bacterium]|nr:sulfotransferase [Acidimicrobiales bacterium]